MHRRVQWFAVGDVVLSVPVVIAVAGVPHAVKVRVQLQSVSREGAQVDCVGNAVAVIVRVHAIGQAVLIKVGVAVVHNAVAVVVNGVTDFRCVGISFWFQRRTVEQVGHPVVVVVGVTCVAVDIPVCVLLVRVGIVHAVVHAVGHAVTICIVFATIGNTISVCIGKPLVGLTVAVVVFAVAHFRRARMHLFVCRAAVVGVGVTVIVIVRVAHVALTVEVGVQLVFVGQCGAVVQVIEQPVAVVIHVYAVSFAVLV